MKKIFLVVLVLFAIKAFAQFSDGEPYNFCTLNGEQYNPGKHNTFQTGNIFKVCIPNFVLHTCL